MNGCTAIVPAYASAATVERTLRDLRRAGGGALRRIIAVCSDTATADVARKVEGVEVIASPVRLSAGRARNVGRRNAVGDDLLLFVDADCRLDSGAVGRLIEELDTAEVDAVAARLISEQTSAVAWLRHLLEFKDYEPGASRPLVWMAPSAVLLCRAEAFDRAGGCPDMWPGEDLVFCHRLARRGGRVGLSASVVARHCHPPGWKTLLLHQVRLGETSAEARRMTGMKGESFSRSLLWAPCLGGARLLRSLVWVLRRRPAHVLRLVFLLGPLFAALGCWTLGFARAGHVQRASAKVGR